MGVVLNRGYTFKLYPNQEQDQLFKLYAGAARFVFNHYRENHGKACEQSSRNSTLRRKSLIVKVVDERRAKI